MLEPRDAVEIDFIAGHYACFFFLLQNILIFDAAKK